MFNETSTPYAGGKRYVRSSAHGSALPFAQSPGFDRCCDASLSMYSERHSQLWRVHVLCSLNVHLSFLGHSGF